MDVQEKHAQDRGTVAYERQAVFKGVLTCHIMLCDVWNGLAKEGNEKSVVKLTSTRTHRVQ